MTGSESTSREPAAPRPPRQGPSSQLLGIAVLCCLGITAMMWWQMRGELSAIREMQRDTATELATLRGFPTIDITGAPAQGRPDAVVTLIEFSDYECPFCIRHFKDTMPKIRASYIDSGKILYVFNDFPIDELHPAAIRAHEAARCAAEQNKFWDLHPRLFSAPGTHDQATLVTRAGDAGLQVDIFSACLASGRTTAAVKHSVETAHSFGATGTPSFFVGLRDAGTSQVRVLQTIAGARPFADFEQAIARVEALVN